MSVRLWEGGRLLDFVVLRRDGDAPSVKSQLSMIAVFLGNVSRNLDIVSCDRLFLDAIETLDRDQYPFDVMSLNAKKLLRKTSYCVIGRKENFALLRPLLRQLLDTVDVEWMRSTQDLPKTQRFYCKLC